MDTAESESYHRRFMGLIPSSRQVREDQMCIDCWKLSQGIAERLFRQDDASLLIQAVNDEYVARHDEEESLESAYRKRI
jgi:hypothetical protein